MAETCELVAPLLPGVTINPATCQVTIDTTSYSNGTYTYKFTKTDDSTNPATVEEFEQRFTVNNPAVPDCKGCADVPQFVDCNDQLITQSQDALGNPVLKFCSTPAANVCITEWNSVTATLPPPCSTNLCRAFDVTTQTFTHTCYNGAWINDCAGCGGTVVDPDRIQVCYDLAGIEGAPAELCLGGGTTGWQINGVNVYNDICGSTTTSTAATGYPVTVLANTGYNNTDGVPPIHADMPGFIAGATDTGQGNGQNTSISVSGDPGTQPWLGSERPLVIVDLQLDSNCVGPFKFRFENPEPGGAIGFAMWDAASNTYLGIPDALATNGTSISYENITGAASGPGDYMVISTQSQNVTTIPFYEIEFLDDGVTGDNIYPVFASLGHSPTNEVGPVETVNNITIEYTRTAGGTQACCDCKTLTQIEALLNTEDTYNNEWVLNGRQICADVSVSHSGNYGALEFCEGTIPPVITGSTPPTFTSAPSSTVCAEQDETICADCTGGTVTLQERVNGVWTNV